MKLRGRFFETGERVELRIDGDLIAEIRRQDQEENMSPVAQDDIWLLPGLFDIQVNGFGGHDFNRERLDPETVAACVESLWQDGVTHLCPTITTNTEKAIITGLKALNTAVRQDPLLNESIPCIHVEGPFISAEDGPRGAHRLEYVRNPDWNEYQKWQEAADGRIKYVTLAPELPGALEFIERLSAAGVVVAIGHSDASPETIRDAVRAGATLSTHLGNGSHALLPRHPNYIWEQAAADGLWASLIADGHHLPPATLKCLIRSKGLERSILTSDAIHLAGLPPGRYPTFEGEAEVSPNGRCSLVGTPYLCGAVTGLRRCVQNAARFGDITLAQAIRLATLNPARALGFEDRLGRLCAGGSATFTVCRLSGMQESIELLATVVSGQVVHQAPKADLSAVLNV